MKEVNLSLSHECRETDAKIIFKSKQLNSMWVKLEKETANFDTQLLAKTFFPNRASSCSLVHFA